MRPEFIIGNGKLCSRPGWIFSNYYSGILFLTALKNTYSSSYYSLMCIEKVIGVIFIVPRIDVVI